jgi:hypothetical protein
VIQAEVRMLLPENGLHFESCGVVETAKILNDCVTRLREAFDRKDGSPG